MSSYFWIRKRIHWSDCDPAGIAWFPKYLGWFEDAEEELFRAVLGQPRQALLDGGQFGMPRVEVSIRYRAPVRPGDLIRIGIASTRPHARRLQHDFEMRSDDGARLIANGFVRVACVSLPAFVARDLPEEITRLVDSLPEMADKQERGIVEVPWT